MLESVYNSRVNRLHGQEIFNSSVYSQDKFMLQAQARKNRSTIVAACLFLSAALCSSLVGAESVLVEAESFAAHGGWKLDTQFIDTMGSPYLLAHGIGRPVKHASTQVEFKKSGVYQVFVRTKDWVAQWGAEGAPGRFQLAVGGHVLDETLGDSGAQWHWQAAGEVEIRAGKIGLELRDLTGFDGRCDAIYFTTESDDAPPNDEQIMSKWRRDKLGLPDNPRDASGYDLVIVGGGYSGMGAALSAARMGCKVALIQNRPVLGGNGSSEVRVWAQGLIRRGEYPRIGEIVDEFADHAQKSPGNKAEFGDSLKEQIVQAEKNIDLFLNHHAYQVEMDGNRIAAVLAFDTRTSERRRFAGRLFSDCTGHATIGALAKADWDMEEKGRMGMSNMWAWAELENPVEFPKTPWALDLNMEDFPYPRDHHGQWFWESGFDKNALDGAESIRDWNLRAVYGAFNAMKNRDGRDKHRTAMLTWVAYIGGPRESRRLMGDVVLTQEDIVAKRKFPDGCVPSTWSIDLHYPKKQYSKKFPDNPFISYAVHDRRVDRTYGYPVPYRCFYSRNIENLFVAGRCISVTHQALGTTRVMKTCGMMGEVVGKAASICTLHACYPRDVYDNYLDELKTLLQLPGKSRRANVFAKMEIPKNVQAARPEGPLSGLDPAKMKGMVVDDVEAKRVGSWTKGAGLKGYVAYGYRYASADSGASATFTLAAPSDGRYELRVYYGNHMNRAARAPLSGTMGEQEFQAEVNMKDSPPNDGAISLGVFSLSKGDKCILTFGTKNAGGLVHIDAVQLKPVEKP